MHLWGFGDVTWKICENIGENLSILAHVTSFDDIGSSKVGWKIHAFLSPF